ncbi:hypothetical protein UFOVP1313_58 [uncultured Caudovirales phage]|uniref:Uncharacterized protein n=1 Tax=uncultured Caudovirales phage TaxID=2100421 RepID=A0A6J5RQD0_9CAUD|nr:hypothetical protein UFOVP1313_58 [uncultured Caudovirales phage]
MGLDMYLTATRFSGGFGAEWPEVNTQEVSRVGYWRKANQIHEWFVENVQDGVDECRECWVDREKLEELKELCESVLLAPANAEKELPRKSGFFFGSTEYSDGYYADLKDTIEIVDRCLSIPEEWEFSYQSSW